MKQLLKDFKAGKVPLDFVLEKIKVLPYQDIGFAKIDTHRIIRKGYPETIFCQGKSLDQILKIVQSIIGNFLLYGSLLHSFECSLRSCIQV